MQDGKWGVSSLGQSKGKPNELHAYKCPQGYCRCTMGTVSNSNRCSSLFQTKNSSTQCACHRTGTHWRLNYMYTDNQPICVSPVCLSRLPVWFLLQRNWCDRSSWQVWAVLPSAWAADCSTRWESRPHCWHCTHQSRAAGSDTCHFHSHSVIADTIVILGVMVVSLWKRFHLPSWLSSVIFYIQVCFFIVMKSPYIIMPLVYSNV